MGTKDRGLSIYIKKQNEPGAMIDCGRRMNDVNAVVLAQAYIKAHHTDAEFGIERVCRAVEYSRRLDRLFQKHTRMTLYEYINAVLLSLSLLETDHEVIDAAPDVTISPMRAAPGPLPNAFS